MTRINEKEKVCRACGGALPKPFLDLGKTPLANALLTAKQLHEPEAMYPLEIAFCASCSLVQITETVPPEKLFREYLYFSSFSDTFVRHAEELVKRLSESRRLGAKSLVVEIASNDGYLLQYYRRQGIPVLGIEPARNVAKVAQAERGIPTLCEFFNEDLAGQLSDRGERADIIHAHNVLAHVGDLNGFVRGLKLLLKDDGVAVIEVPYVKDMIDHCEFDTIYHEHLCYFSLTALDGLFKRHGMIIKDVERRPIHGGSLRLFISKAAGADHGPAVRALLSDEASWGLSRLEYYQDFARRVEQLKQSLCALLTTLKREGNRMAAYGAPAKGNTLLNYCGVRTDLLDYTVDRSPHKQGKFLPGTHIPILHPDRIRDTQPDYILILPWNIKEEIMSQMAHVREWGAKFVIPVPEAEVLA